MPVTGSVGVTGSTSPAAPAHPILLRGELPADPGSSSTITLFDDRTGSDTQQLPIAIGSITVSTQGGGSSAVMYIVLRATNCQGNGLGGVEDLTVRGDSTEHLDFPVPEIAPVVGSPPYCIVADVLNGNELNGGQMTIRVVGYGVS